MDKFKVFFNASILRKVPEVGLIFWVIKLLTTALGESTSDFLVYTYNPYVVVILGFMAFGLALALQFAVRRYVVWAYWLAVLMVAIFGTMAADVIHVVLGVPYLVSTIVFSLGLIVIFGVWYRVEGSLSIHSITTRRRELFYWLTVLATFALGTAAGDLAAYTLHLGFLAAAVMFATIFAIPAIGYLALRWNPIFCFWFAYILTRPIGASVADWLGKGHEVGGLGVGDGPVILVLGLAAVCLVGYLSMTQSKADATVSTGH